MLIFRRKLLYEVLKEIIRFFIPVDIRFFKYYFLIYMDENYISRLPDALLEHLLTYLNPYKDLDNARLVCRRWNETGRRAIAHMKRHFKRCQDFAW